MASRAVLGAFLLAAACGGGPRPARISPMLIEVDDAIAEHVMSALQAETRLEPADSLYEADAVLVANGESRHLPPRFAGIGQGGVVAVTSSRVEVRPGLAWIQIAYRWMSTAEGLAREGRATVVLVPDGQGAWRIRHAHSSSPP